MRSRTSSGFCTFATAAKHTVEAGTVIEAAHTNALGSAIGSSTNSCQTSGRNYTTCWPLAWALVTIPATSAVEQGALEEGVWGRNL